MKSSFLFLIAGVFLANPFANAQDNFNYVQGHDMIQINLKDNEKPGISGTPYLYNEYRPGRVTVDGKEPFPVYLRYNIKTETFEIKTDQSGKETYVLPLKAQAKYHLGSDIFIYRTIKIDGKDITGYFQTHFNGDKVSLLEKYSLKILEGVKAENGYGNDRPGQMKIIKDLYLVFNDGPARKVNLKVKDFEKAFSSSPLVKTYLAENKLKTLDDYTKLLKWYDKQGE